MAQPNVRTTEEGMQVAEAQFADKSSRFSSDLSSVESQIAALSSTWQGQASASFQGAMDIWSQQFQKIIAQLIRMREMMGGNRNEYVSTEEGNVSAANAFQSALPNV